MDAAKKLKLTQDEYCYCTAEIELWFERGQCGFVDLWTLFTVARALEENIERLETEVLVDSILNEFEPPSESRDLIDEICCSAPTLRHVPKVVLPEEEELLDIDVTYEEEEEEQSNTYAMRHSKVPVAIERVRFWP